MEEAGQWDSPSSANGSGTDSPIVLGSNGKPKRVANAPFRRIKVEDATYADVRLMDNSFSARVSHASVIPCEGILLIITLFVVVSRLECQIMVLKLLLI